ncbi:MAG TPA: 7-cyano-7-deazaguanine synthase [Candidatus Binatia bacterium]|nr:7-cyano-7-deazaguanine synthase [Candidatus Binatia bacterium]
MAATPGPVAVLCSGGLDSAVLLVEMARSAGRAEPVFVRAGHVWERAEREALARFVAAVDDVRIGPIRDLAVPAADVYGAHWSMTGRGSPAWDAPDEAVELRGRNLILLAKALVLAAIEGWPTVALGTLGGNPFPDATPGFFAKVAAAASEGLRAPLAVAAPYRTLTKAEVIRRGVDLPLELTLSCLRPTAAGLHCGDCNKCRERVEAFDAAAVTDRTVYARPRAPSSPVRVRRTD